MSRRRGQIARVRGGVLQHLGRQWPGRPVRPLEALVEPDAHVFLEQRRQADAGLVEQLRGDPRVEDRGGAEAVLAVQEAEIVVRVVEDDLHLRIGQHHGERRQALHGQRVHHGRLVARADLQQVDAVDEPVEARGLGVDREQRRAPEAREQRLQIGLRLDERNAGGAHSDFETSSSPAAISSSAFASTL